MSGAEAILVLGVISSIVAIVDGTKQVYDAATNAQGLPKAFREVAGRLPIVMNILLSTKQSIDKGYADENSCKAVKHIVEACEKKAKKLDELFHKAIPAHGASDLKRYYRAVKVLGKGNEVENLMKAMLEDLQLLAYEHGMRIATKAEQDQIVQAITTVSAISPSVPEDVFQETRLTTSNSGPSTETLPQGGTAAQSSSRQDNSIGGHMTSGKDSNYPDCSLLLNIP